MGTSATIIITGGLKGPFMDPVSILSVEERGHWEWVVPAIPRIIEKCEKETEEDLFNAVSNAFEKESECTIMYKSKFDPSWPIKDFAWLDSQYLYIIDLNDRSINVYTYPDDDEYYINWIKQEPYDFGEDLRLMVEESKEVYLEALSALDEINYTLNKKDYRKEFPDLPKKSSLVFKTANHGIYFALLNTKSRVCLDLLGVNECHFSSYICDDETNSIQRVWLKKIQSILEELKWENGLDIRSAKENAYRLYNAMISENKEIGRIYLDILQEVHDDIEKNEFDLEEILELSSDFNTPNY